MSCPFSEFACIYYKDHDCEATGEKCILNKCECYDDCKCCIEDDTHGGICEDAERE